MTYGTVTHTDAEATIIKRQVFEANAASHPVKTTNTKSHTKKRLNSNTPGHQ